MIIDMEKYLFVGAKGDLAEFFVDAQEQGCIEFLTKSGKKTEDYPDAVNSYLSAIKILRKLPIKDPTFGENTPSFALDTAEQVIELNKEVEKLKEEKRLLEADISRVAPFGSFSFTDIEFIQEHANKVIQFYCVKTSKTHELQEAPSLVYINTEYDLDYYIGIHDTPQNFPGVIEMQVDQTAAELKNHHDFVEETLAQVEAELKGYAGYLELLRDHLLGAFDQHSLAKAQTDVDFPIEGSLFSIEGWVPENKKESLLQLIEGKAVFFEPIKVEEEDKVPTYMENTDLGQVGEDLVRFYDTPAATDKDPSNWVLWAFTLFFAMIFADGGYGLIYLAMAFFLKQKFPKIKGSGKRLLKLFFILSAASIVWGVLTTSFFGINFNPTQSITKISPVRYLAKKKADYVFTKQTEDAKEWTEKFPQLSGLTDGNEILAKAKKEQEGQMRYEIYEKYSDNVLFEFSLLVGVVHIALSMLRYAKRNWANFGWAIFAIGGYFYFPISLKATSMVEFLQILTPSVAQSVGQQLMYGGIGGAVVLSFIQNKWKGLLEITQLIQIFADILSYLRLYALALASALMARTFNQIGVGVGLVAGWAVILAGHSTNITLATMSGVIHGLRLNFIEWYRYSYEGEGKLFNPLRKLRMKQE